MRGRVGYEPTARGKASARAPGGYLPGMDVTLITADFAQVDAGRVNIIGGWWDMTHPAPTPRALALVFTLDWGELDATHEWHLTLRDADGAMAQFGDGELLDLRGQFTVGRSDMMKPGRPVRHAVAINLAPVALPPGEQLVWHISCDGVERADWRLAFSVVEWDTGSSDD